MIYALILVACSSQGCAPHLIASGMTLTQCNSVSSQATAAQFIGQHPDLSFKRMICTPNPRQQMQEKEI